MQTVSQFSRFVLPQSYIISEKWLKNLHNLNSKWIQPNYRTTTNVPSPYKKKIHPKTAQSPPQSYLSSLSRPVSPLSYPANNDDDDDTSDHRMNLRFITQRRGPSSRAVSSVGGAAGADDDDDEIDFEDDDETMMLNMQRQLQRAQLPVSREQPERLQFDMNELLQLTPLKPLMRINGAGGGNGPAQVADELEPTATIQLTQR